ncbi:hypothetical protein GCM10010156_19150 [Planobispora rosea]|uniref:Htaa domain protein n=1 Tax=Planobispora rosea TaxID=35762 RepID=A0A8J3WDK6_PLARO|nr:hypothetical protein [Planobispora rosea]GGS60591.1 hypothetical protein GCM10010156_19150 [Planobispora rosea]GIH83986.1 hypothetical protein Pro02_23940 [Planobispora rosea]
MRLLLATATGAAVLAGSVATALVPTTALAATECSKSDEFSKVEWTDAFVPLEKNNKVTVTAVLKSPFKKNADGTWERTADKKAVYSFTSVTGDLTKADNAKASLTVSKLPDPPAVADDDLKKALPEVKVTAEFEIAKADKDGKWTLNLSADNKACSAEITVDPQVKFVSAAVTDPVVLRSGEDTEVKVRANVIGASSVKGKLYSDDEADSVDVTLTKGSGNAWHTTTSFDTSYATGSWTLELVASRGGQDLKTEKADTFYVQKSSSKKKTKSRVSFDVSANKVRKGTSVRLFGKVYRGYSAYSGKTVGLYYKKKGGSWKFAYYVKASSTGKFSKTVKPRFDAYWRAVVGGTSKTHGSTSGYEYVDVR